MRKLASGRAKCDAMLTPTKRDLVFQLTYTLRLSDHVMIQENNTKHLKLGNEK